MRDLINTIFNMMIVEKFEKLNYNFPSIYLYKCIYH